MKEENVGLVFAVMGLSFFLGCMIAGKLCTLTSRVFVIQFGMFAISFCLLLVGPTKYITNYEDNNKEEIYTITGGIFLVGVCVAFMYTPVIPEIVAEMIRVLGEKNKASISDRASALTN